MALVGIDEITNISLQVCKFDLQIATFYCLLLTFDSWLLWIS